MWSDGVSMRFQAGHANISFLNYANLMRGLVPLSALSFLLPWAGKRRFTCTKQIRTQPVRLCKQRVETDEGGLSGHEITPLQSHIRFFYYHVYENAKKFAHFPF